MARKRRRARETGICQICCKRRSQVTSTVCTRCSREKVERQRRKRQRDREAVKLQQVIALREKAGDEANAYHLYADATRYYQQALNVPFLANADRKRIAEKISQAFFLSGDL